MMGSSGFAFSIVGRNLLVVTGGNNSNDTEDRNISNEMKETYIPVSRQTHYYTIPGNDTRRYDQLGTVIEAPLQHKSGP